MVPAVTVMGSPRFIHTFAMILMTFASGSVWAQQDSDCAKSLESGTTQTQTSFLVLPRGGYFSRLTSELETKELTRLASQFNVQWVDVDPGQRRVTAKVPSHQSERWLKHLRAHPRVAGILNPSLNSAGQLAPGIDRQLLKYMKKMPEGVLFTVLVSFPSEELARPFLELLMRRKVKGSLSDDFATRGGVKPVRSVRVLENHIEVLLEDSNDRMMTHLRLIPAASNQVRAELVSAY